MVSAMARPIPLAPPVTTVVVPEKSNVTCAIPPSQIEPMIGEANEGRTRTC